MKRQWVQVAVVAIVLSFVAVGCGSNAAPASPPTQPPPTLPPTATPIPPEHIVSAAMQGWDREGVDAGQVDATLAYFADDAAFKMVGFPPEIPADLPNKAAIRQAYESWLPLHPRLQVKIEKTEGDRVIATTSYWSDPTRAMGIAPLVGTDVYVVKNGKITQETWTLTDESRQAFAAAMARAAAPKVATTAAGFPIGSFRSIPARAHINFNADGSYQIPAIMGNAPINGTMTVTGDQVVYKDDWCPGPGIYTWKFEGVTLTQRLVSDDCRTRKSIEAWVVR